MAILKRKSNVANMEFYHNAIKLRVTMTEFLLRDFGLKNRRRNLEFAKDAYDMADDELKKLKISYRLIMLRMVLLINFLLNFIDRE